MLTFPSDGQTKLRPLCDFHFENIGFFPITRRILNERFSLKVLSTLGGTARQKSSPLLTSPHPLPLTLKFHTLNVMEMIHTAGRGSE